MEIPNNLSEKQYFMLACFSENLQDFYSKWIEQGRKQGRLQFFTKDSKGNYVHKYWIPSNVCCESGDVLTTETIDVKVSYWTPNLWKPIRKDLKINNQKKEAYECQKIDCSCNDCFFLDRVKSWCNKLEKKVNVSENLCHPQNQVCFKHRLDNL